LINWSIEAIRFTLQYNWKLSRNETFEKTNFIITVRDGMYKAQGEIAPNIRYNETASSVRADFSKFLQTPLNSIEHVKTISAHVNSLDISNAVKFGIESAAIHLLALKKNETVARLLHLPQAKSDGMDTCYTIPVMGVSSLRAFIVNNNLKRFNSLKIKVNAETARDVITEINKLTTQPIKIDGNEAWSDPDDFLRFVEIIKNCRIDFIEQPFPSTCTDEYKYTKTKCAFELMADESVLSMVDFKSIASQFHGINMKLMKAGGYLRGWEIIKGAQQEGLKTMIGCMVESSLGISSAMNLAHLVDYRDLDGYFIIKDEPFNLVKERDGLLYLNT
jgi:L-alanine-DL-glutamate epimerase-like enolase superfamily enzyme